LESIAQQLNGERVKKVLKFLEQNKSTYTGPFSKLQKEVQIARDEARENSYYLETLSKLFDELIGSTVTDAEQLTALADLFVPIMHTILLIWTYSQHYNTPSRLVVLIREICNAIIMKCRQYIDGRQILTMIGADETALAHEQLTVALDVCARFKEAYFEYKSKAKNQWKITTNALFVRLDAFSERCQDIMHLTSTIIQFSKLEKIEIGNTKGSTLSATVKSISERFREDKREFLQVTYDILDIEERKFDDDFYKFRQRIKELERRLASTLTQGFDDCDTLIGKFKLLDSFEGLLNRPIIQDELEKKHITLLELYKQDLKSVGAIFMEGKALVDRADERAPISNNLPPIAGALNWTAGLRERIQEPMDKLGLLSQSIQDREEYKDVQKLYASLCKNLREYNEQKIRAWEQGVEEHTDDQLNKFLLYREETPLVEEGFVRVNFDPVLVRLLREVKYLLLLDIEVPQRASLLYRKVDVYRTQTGSLDIIVTMYNEILATLLPVEKPLLADRIERMNKALYAGMHELRWNSQNIDPFISQAMTIVTEVDELVKKMKDNVRKMQEDMRKWERPLFERKMKPAAPEDLEQTHASLLMSRFDEIRNQGKEIHKLMKDTADNIKPDKKAGTWLSYVDYVNGLVIDGITTGIHASLAYLADQISVPYNKLHACPPMFDVKVDLRDREVVFDPSIQSNGRGNGIRDILQKIVDDFVSLSIQMPRLDTNSGDYLVEIKDQFELFGAMQTFSNHFHDTERATGEYLNQYQGKEFLWKETLQESFQAFLDTGVDPREQEHKKVNDDGEEEEDETFAYMAEKILDGVQTKRPNLEAFDEKITFLTAIRDEIVEASLRPTVDIGWLRVNATPLIKELEKTANQWIAAYTGFLLDNTTREIENIEQFIQTVSQGTQDLPKSAEKKADKERLMRVMAHLRDVKMIKDRTLEEVEPMKQAVMLLKKHQQSFPKDADFIIKLENSKTALIEVSVKALGPIKEAILPLQTQEAKAIKDRLRAFAIKVGEYRQVFQGTCPYHVASSSPELIASAYNTITEYYAKTNELVAEAAELNNLETLFDMQKSSYKQLKDCKTELVLLKQMWDLVSLIDYQFEAW
jgi:dynein heavy chain